MKVIKLSVLAVILGLFAASCGGAKTGDGNSDTLAPTIEMPPTTPAMSADTNHVDTQNAKPAKPAAEVNAAEAAKK